MPRNSNPHDSRHIAALLRVLADSPIPVESYKVTAAGPEITFFAGKRVEDNAGATPGASTQDGTVEDGWVLVTNLPPTDAKWVAPLSDDELAAIGDA